MTAIPRGATTRYVACFCESPDLLSQWRAYGRGGGYAVGFRTAGFAGMSVEVAPPRDPPAILLRQVIYDIANAHALLDEMSQSADEDPPSMIGLHAYRQLRSIVLPTLASIKHPAFAEEREWRVMCTTAEQPDDFRAGSLGVVPYLNLLLPNGPIGEIVVGPGPHPELRINGAVQLLRSRGMWDVPVTASPSPLRT